jgi:chromosome transmission fidelity protein 1
LQETREALGIWLEGAVLVIDEAHNLVDAVNGAHSAALSAGAASAAAGQLDAYWSRFSIRLAPGGCMAPSVVDRPHGAVSFFAA